MEKINSYYESLFIVDVSNGEDAVNASVEKFVGMINANAETVVEIDKWGKRRLAYPINDKPEGYYVVATYQSAPEFPAEFERIANIDESILRSMTIKLDFVPVAKAKAAPVAEAAAVEEAAPVADAE